MQFDIGLRAVAAAINRLSAVLLFTMTLLIATAGFVLSTNLPIN